MGYVPNFLNMEYLTINNVDSDDEWDIFVAACIQFSKFSLDERDSLADQKVLILDNH